VWSPRFPLWLERKRKKEGTTNTLYPARATSMVQSKKCSMAYRFQTLRAAFRSLAPALQAAQLNAGKPECTLLPAAQTGRRTATVADSKRKTTAQALAELYATAQASKLQAVNNAVKSGFEALGSDMGNIRSDLDASVARLDAKVAVLDTAF
jgi:hypothetical protein